MMNRTRTSTAAIGIPFLVLVGIALSMPRGTHAQLHGGQVQKGCTSLRACGGVLEKRCSLSLTRCATSSECPSGQVCNEGNACTGDLNCATGTSFVCVGGPDDGILCDPQQPLGRQCRAGMECAQCAPIPLALSGDSALCEIVVSNQDTAPGRHKIAIDDVSDTVKYASGPEVFPNLLSTGVFGQCRAPDSVSNYPDTGKRCFENGGCAAPGSCSVDSACIGTGTDVFKRCVGPADCGAGTSCVRNPQCVDASSMQCPLNAACGPKCDFSEPASCTSGACSVILPNEQDFLIVQHTEQVLPGDPEPLILNDLAMTTGRDMGTMLPFTLTFPGHIDIGTPPIGCRITGGGIVSGVTDPTMMAEISNAHFAGQVGAPCGCRGCFTQFDPKLAEVQGSWHHNQKGNGGGTLSPVTYNSLTCGCDDPKQVGDLCPAAEHPKTPADQICVTGIANFSTSAGNKNPTRVAFRFEATDHGESGIGINKDHYRMRAFKPSKQTEAAVQALADTICCTNPESALPKTSIVVDDSGDLVAGNIQIHRELKKSSDGECPPPRGVCVQ